MSQREKTQQSFALVNHLLSLHAYANAKRYNMDFLDSVEFTKGNLPRPARGIPCVIYKISNDFEKEECIKKITQIGEYLKSKGGEKLMIELFKDVEPIGESVQLRQIWDIEPYKLL